MSTYQDYAPTSLTSFTVSSDSVKYSQEISKSTLIETSTHHSVYNALAEVCSILPTLDMLEVSFIKDFITEKEKYTTTTYRLINQYQMILKGFDNDAIQVLQKLLPDLENDLSNFLPLFVDKFNLNCPQAVKRLISGVPSVIDQVSHNSAGEQNGDQNGNQNGQNSQSVSGNARLIAEITGNFITCMDALKLNYSTRAQLHPLLSDLVVNLNELSENIQFEGKSKLINWLIKINNLEKELNQEDSDAFLKDLDFAYKGFYSSLDR